MFVILLSRLAFSRLELPQQIEMNKTMGLEEATFIAPHQKLIIKRRRSESIYVIVVSEKAVPTALRAIRQEKH